MTTRAARLLDLIHEISSEPWPATTAERTRWAKQVGLPTAGTPVSDDGQSDDSAFTAGSHGGRVYWDLSSTGSLVHVSLLIATPDPAEFDNLRADAETLRNRLDHAWERVDEDVKGADWRAEWHAGTTDVEIYWSDARRNDPPTDACLHIAFSPDDASSTPPHDHWQVALRGNARDVDFAQQTWCEPPATTLRVVRFMDTSGSAVATATVAAPGDVGASGAGQDETTARIVATTMAINLASEAVPQVQVRALIDDAADAERWEPIAAVVVDNQPCTAWARESRPGLWSVYALRAGLMVAAAFRTDPRSMTLHVSTTAPEGVEAVGLNVVEVDERDSSWEVHMPRFRVYIHDSGPDSTQGATATHDITGADVLQVIDWAQQHTHGDQTWSVALVVDDEAQEALNPGHGRGLVWLVGADGNDSPSTPDIAAAQHRMLTLRATGDIPSGPCLHPKDSRSDSPRAHYDAEADAAYIYLVNKIEPGEVAKTIPVPSLGDPWIVNVDVDEQGRLLGLEVLAANHLLRPEMLR